MKILTPYGEIGGVSICSDKSSGVRQGMAVVQLYPASFEKAEELLNNPIRFAGQDYYFTEIKKKAIHSEAVHVLSIQKLHSQITIEEIEKKFSNYGHINNIYLQYTNELKEEIVVCLVIFDSVGENSLVSEILKDNSSSPFIFKGVAADLTGISINREDLTQMLSLGSSGRSFSTLLHYQGPVEDLKKAASKDNLLLTPAKRRNTEIPTLHIEGYPMRSPFSFGLRKASCFINKRKSYLKNLAFAYKYSFLQIDGGGEILRLQCRYTC